ncbi:MAG: response regulator transcription factor [Niastella sp.]|nr:response regulator transcription factor [Niastella sp.]
MKTSCLIVDDEPLAQQLLQKHVQEAGSLELAGACRNAMEASVFLHAHPVDLLFLDIQMPKLTGLEWLRLLKDPPLVIITTAHREYALEGYSLDVVDYLLKPITFDRFMAAVEKFFRRKQPCLPSARQEQPAITAASFLLKSGGKTYQLIADQIVYIESVRDYVQFYFDNGKKLLLKYKIGDLETELPPHFIRVHKSFIVHKGKVTAFTATMIELGAYTVPVGNNYKAMMENAMWGK